VDRIRDVIRYGVTTDLSERAIGRALKVSRTAVAKYLGLSVSSHTLSQQSETPAGAGTSHDEILWHTGDIDSAFAAARAARKPVLLYWGADWCPPCSRLKATVFRRPEFVERTRQFVAVDLDGDEPGAQRLGEEFGVDGYPTVIVLTPDREEITRIPITLEREQYVRALDVSDR